MARRIEFPTFDPAKPVVARKRFTANGHRFEPGKPFPWQRMAIDTRKAQKLFDTGYIRHPKNGDQVDYTMPQAETVSVPQRSADTTHRGYTASGWESDGLDDIDSLIELKAIAEREGAPTTVSKEGQRRLIREHRAKQ